MALHRSSGDVDIRELVKWDVDVSAGFSFQSMLGSGTGSAPDGSPINARTSIELDMGHTDGQHTIEPRFTQTSTPGQESPQQIRAVYIRPSQLSRSRTAQSSIYIGTVGGTTNVPSLFSLPPSPTMTTPLSLSPLLFSPSASLHAHLCLNFHLRPWFYAGF